MADKTKQHYVPKFYLRHFAQGKLFNIYNLKTDEVKQNVPFGSQCYKNNFYGKDKVYEEELSKLESSWSNTISNILADVNNISFDDESLLKQFCCFQYLRTEAAFLHTRNLYYNWTKKILPMLAQFKGIEATEQQIDDFAYNYSQTAESKENTTKRQIDMAKEHCKLFDNLQLTILENNTDLEFIANDNPVIMGNEFQQKDGIGMDCLGIYFLFPISPKYYVIVSDAKIYFRLKGIGLISADKGIVEKLNVLQYQHCLENVFSQTTNGVEFIQNYIQEKSQKIKDTFIETYNKTKNNFLSMDEKAKANQLHNVFVDSINSMVWRAICKEKTERISFDFLDIHKLAMPFVNKCNYSFHRSADIETANKRVMFMSIAISLPDFIPNKQNKKEVNEELSLVKLWGEFLNKYFNNEL